MLWVNRPDARLSKCKGRSHLAGVQVQGNRVPTTGFQPIASIQEVGPTVAKSSALTG